MLNLKKKKKSVAPRRKTTKKIARYVPCPPPLFFMLNGQFLSEINVPSFNSSANFAIKIVTICFPS